MDNLQSSLGARFESAVAWLASLGVNEETAQLAVALAVLTAAGFVIANTASFLTWIWHATHPRRASARAAPSHATTAESERRSPARQKPTKTRTSLGDNTALLERALTASAPKLAALGSVGPGEDSAASLRAALLRCLGSDDPRGRRIAELLADGKGFDALQLVMAMAHEAKVALGKRTDRKSRQASAQLWLDASRIASMIDTTVSLTASQMAVEVDPDNADACVEVAQLYQRVHDEPKAEQWYRRALANARDDKSVEASAAANLAVLLKARSERTEAEGLLRRADALNNEVKRPALSAGVLIELADIVERRDPAAAEDMLNRALASAKRGGARKEQSRALIAMGIRSGARGAFEASEQQYRQALAIDEADGDKSGQATALGNLGAILTKRGELEEAERHLRKAAALNSELGRRDFESSNLYNLATIAMERDDLDSAEALVQQSLALMEQAGSNEDAAARMVLLGSIARDRGNLAAASRHYERSLAKAVELSDEADQAIALHNLGDIAGRRGDFDQARSLFARALSINERIGRQEGISNNLSMIGHVARVKENWADAEDCYRRALAIDERLGRKIGQAAQLFNLGLVAEAQGNRQKQCELWARSRDHYREAGVLHEVRDIERRLQAIDGGSAPQARGFLGQT